MQDAAQAVSHSQNKEIKLLSASKHRDEGEELAGEPAEKRILLTMRTRNRKERVTGNEEGRITPPQKSGETRGKPENYKRKLEQLLLSGRI